MMARRDFGHDPAVGLMGSDLGGNFTREQLATAQNGDGRFVAGGFNCEQQRFHLAAENAGAAEKAKKTD
jgi:hypothetical protein